MHGEGQDKFLTKRELRARDILVNAQDIDIDVTQARRGRETMSLKEMAKQRLHAGKDTRTVLTCEPIGACSRLVGLHVVCDMYFRNERLSTDGAGEFLQLLSLRMTMLVVVLEAYI